MATDTPMIRDGVHWTAASDLSAKQFYCVKSSGAGTCDVETTGGLVIIGILQNKPTSGQVADICILGVTKAKAGGAGWTHGDHLATEPGTGLLVTNISGGTTVATAVGDAASGEIGEVHIGNH